MNTSIILRLSVIFSLVILCSACGDLWTDQGFQPIEVDSEFYYSGLVVGHTNSASLQIDIAQYKENGDPELFFMGSTLSRGAAGPTLLVGAYTNKTNPSVFPDVPRIELQFWPGSLAEQGTWSDAAVEAFFAAGNTFELGNGEMNQFGLKVLLPIVGDGGLDARASSSDFLENPTGTLTITAVDDYRFTDYAVSEEATEGLMVKCAFEAEIGRYNLAADEADGNQAFITDEVVQVLDGEAVIFVPYGLSL